VKGIHVKWMEHTHAMPPLSNGSAHSPDDHLIPCGAFFFLELCGFGPSILASPEL
jgi:hypothetical protein